MPPHVWDFLDEFTEALCQQLVDDEKRWGDTWLKRPRRGQAQRALDTFCRYEEEHCTSGEPFPWLKVAGEAVIGWTREVHPDLSANWANADD